MAVTRISELTPILTPGDNNLLIINDGDTTNSITFTNLSDSVVSNVQAANLVFAGSVELDGIVTVDGVMTVNGDVTFLGEVGGIEIDELSDVDTSTALPLEAQALVWVSANSKWEPRDVSPAAGTTATSVNGQTDTVILTADDIDDSLTTHKFATSVQLGLADTSLQPTDNVSELTNDASYLIPTDNVSLLTNDSNFIDASGAPVQTVNTQTGDVVLDADDIDDTSSTHKFATASQLSDAESALQSGDTLQSADGTETQPGLSFVSDPNTGLYSSAADVLSVTTNAAPTAHFTSTAGVGALEIVGSDGGVILASPNGTRYMITVTDGGSLSTVLVGAAPTGGISGTGFFTTTTPFTEINGSEVAITFSAPTGGGVTAVGTAVTDGSGSMIGYSMTNSGDGYAVGETVNVTEDSGAGVVEFEVTAVF